MIRVPEMALRCELAREAAVTIGANALAFPARSLLLVDVAELELRAIAIAVDRVADAGRQRWWRGRDRRWE